MNYSQVKKPAKILDGKWLASLYHSLITERVSRSLSKARRSPGLAVILVGDNPASKSYVSSKGKVAVKCGFRTFDAPLPASATFDQVKSTIEAFNGNPEVDGILLQLPLPPHLDSNALLNFIDPSKDVDGLHPFNQGLLLKGEALLKPCTPLGVMRLIDLALASVEIGAEGVVIEDIPQADLAGKRAVVVGRSILVGKPAGMMLLERNATLVMAHSKTPELEKVVAEADIVVAAVGRPEMIKGSWLKPGAIVIDVGINRLESGPRAGKLTGDVEFTSACEVASAITPVPGGAGLMTVAMLIYNTLLSFEAREGISR